MQTMERGDAPEYAREGEIHYTAGVALGRVWLEVNVRCQTLRIPLLFTSVFSGQE